jgi:FecR-like protein
MTDDRLRPNRVPPNTEDPVALEADRRRGAEALARLADEPARVEFRARLRDAFQAGAIPSPAIRSPAPGTTASALAGRFAVHPGGASRRPWLTAGRGRILVPLAAVAALVAVVTLDRAPAWRVTHVSGEGIAIVDQTPVPLNHVDELAAAIHPGARVRVPDGAEIEITGGTALVIRMLSGTDAIVPPTPSRWLHRRVAGRIDHGQWRITTGPPFAGARLEIETPHADVEVMGTTLSVICEPTGTCVCVFEGRVRVGHTSRDRVSVEAGHLRYLWADGGEPKVSGIRPIENEQLGTFRQEKRAELERGR